jgi:hypothetical protein
MGSFKNFLKNYQPRKAEISCKLCTKASLLKSWPLGVDLGHNRKTFYIGKVLKNLLKNHLTKRAENGVRWYVGHGHTEGSCP